MLRRRLIYKFLTDGDFFYLSRNFRLQKIGDLNWLIQDFDFQSLVGIVDEICIVNPLGRPISELRHHIDFFSKNALTPLSLVGGLQSPSMIRDSISLGVEKVGFSSAIFSDPGLVKAAIAEVGSQAVFAQVDFRNPPNTKEHTVFINSGSIAGAPLHLGLQIAEELGVGEVILHSIDREGTGVGFDLGVLELVKDLRLPVVLSGGAGRTEHFLKGFQNLNLSGLATSNLLNFMATGVKELREDLDNCGFEMAKHETPPRPAKD